MVEESLLQHMCASNEVFALQEEHPFQSKPLYDFDLTFEFERNENMCKSDDGVLETIPMNTNDVLPESVACRIPAPKSASCLLWDIKSSEPAVSTRVFADACSCDGLLIVLNETQSTGFNTHLKGVQQQSTFNAHDLKHAGFHLISASQCTIVCVYHHRKDDTPWWEALVVSVPLPVDNDAVVALTKLAQHRLVNPKRPRGTIYGETLITPENRGKKQSSGTMLCYGVCQMTCNFYGSSNIPDEKSTTLLHHHALCISELEKLLTPGNQRILVVVCSHLLRMYSPYSFICNILYYSQICYILNTLRRCSSEICTCNIC